MDLGLSISALRTAIRAVADGVLTRLARDAEAAGILGLGTVQLEALGAWMRFANLVEHSRDAVALSRLGQALHRHDEALADSATWWVLHWEIANSYAVWAVLSRLPQGIHSPEGIEAALAHQAPGLSSRTIKNARTALIRALEDTPLGQDLGLVRLEREGRRVTGLTKLPVRHGQAPMAAVAYALLDWSRREELPSAALESLAAAHGPGPVLHMSAGVLERYLIDIDGAFRGRVLTYSRTAGLDEAYFKHDVTPLQVLVSHYLHVQQELAWLAALDRAQEEVGGEDEAER